MLSIEKKASRPFVFIALLVLAGSAFATRPENPSNGTVYQSDSSVEVWQASTGEWVSPETFWLDYSAQSKGKFWGRSSDYPPYDETGEHDTLVIEAQGGPCMMYFFHKRWRRAQDVVRWDPAFNEVLGCPNVFD